MRSTYFQSLAYYIFSLSLLMGCREGADSHRSVKISDFHDVQCYAHYSDDDTIQLSLTSTQPTVVGRIEFSALGGTDRNRGPIQGIMHGDTLVADYWLEYHGERSTIAAPVAFLRQGNQFIEGFGDIEEHDGKFKFKRLSAVRFDTTRILRPTTCLELPKAY